MLSSLLSDRKDFSVVLRELGTKNLHDLFHKTLGELTIHKTFTRGSDFGFKVAACLYLL